MEMHYTYNGTIREMRGGIYTLIPGSVYRDRLGTDRASFIHANGDASRNLMFASLGNMLPIGMIGG